MNIMFLKERKEFYCDWRDWLLRNGKYLTHLDFQTVAWHSLKKTVLGVEVESVRRSWRLIYFKFCAFQDVIALKQGRDIFDLSRHRPASEAGGGKRESSRSRERRVDQFLGARKGS